MSLINDTIHYCDCTNVLLYLWMENVLTDGEYNKIMDKLNKWYKESLNNVAEIRPNEDGYEWSNE